MSNLQTLPGDFDSPLMRRATTHVSVVVGCYNAAQHLEKRVRQLVAFLDNTGRDYEVLIVEDGSADDSLPILRRLESDVPAITVLSNPRNMGRLLHSKRYPQLARPLHHLHRHRHGAFDGQRAWCSRNWKPASRLWSATVAFRNPSTWSTIGWSSTSIAATAAAPRSTRSSG